MNNDAAGPGTFWFQYSERFVQDGGNFFPKQDI